MSQGPITRSSLLVRLREGQDRAAWGEFVDLYGPMVYRYGRRRGLQDADAADLLQEVMHAVSASLGRSYDPARGGFRPWLFGVTRRQMLKQMERNRRGPRGAGDTATLDQLQEQPAPEDTAWWEEEYKRRRFAWAAARVKPRFEEATWQAFWRTAVEGEEARATAEGLGMSIGAVYTAKSRVLDRIKKEIVDLEENHE